MKSWDKEKIDRLAFKIASTLSTSFIGKGKLQPYKRKDDSWILHQMKEKKYDSGIKVEKDKNKRIHFRTNE